MTVVALLALSSCCVWAYLVLFRGGFWRSDQRLPERPTERADWPRVTAVIPARNEAETIARTVRSLLCQDYAGPLSIVVVDDHSDDGTAERARAAAQDSPRVEIVRGRPLPAGWTGKLWAVCQGIEFADRTWPGARFLLLTDADIEHEPDTLRRLVDRAERDGRDLVSLMVLLECRRFWERLLVPAFVFFFQKLYPFAWVNDAARRQAAAGGGCMLVRREALRRAGDIGIVRGALIDDCALAGRIKDQGSIWLGLSDGTRSLRAYSRLGQFWQMVARTAYTQLDHSPLRLAGTVLGMALVYAVPPASAAWGLATADPLAAVAGALAWLTMATMMGPTLALYRLSPAWGAALPLAAFLFTLMTVDSARRHWRGQGGRWKGRTYGGHPSRIT